MATITIQTDDALLTKLEKIAEARHTTLDTLVTEILSRQTESEVAIGTDGTAYDDLMARLRSLGPLPHLSREERNER